MDELERLQTILRQTQLHLAQTERIRTVGSLSGLMAHELNNVFGSVIGRAQLMQMKTTDERILRECAYIIQAAEQGVSELKRLLHFIQKSRQQLFGPLSLPEVFQEACAVLEPAFERLRGAGRTVELETDFEPHATIFGYVAEVREIIVHLLENALEAMPDGGRITASCRYTPSDVTLSITDTGAGIDSGVQAKMFDPMFTTKGEQHAGMGLTVVKELLRKMKGFLAVATEPGRGSTFSAVMPKNDMAPAMQEPHQPPKLSGFDQHFVSKILIVDDDEDVLAPLEQMLASKGFITKALLNSRDALAAARTFQPDVIITDLAMPEMNGLELAKALRLICPSSKIIMTTAYTDVLPDAEMKQSPIDAVLPKPVNIADLMNRIMSL